MQTEHETKHPKEDYPIAEKTKGTHYLAREVSFVSRAKAVSTNVFR